MDESQGSEQQQQQQQQAMPQQPQQQQPGAHGGDFDRFRRNQGTILFVGNLPFQTPWQHVKDHFRTAGKVRYTDLIADRSGRPKGSALVTMMTPEDADNAIRMFNETDFEGRRLIVRHFDDGPRPPLVQREMMPPYNVQRRHFYGAGAPGGQMGGVGGPYHGNVGAQGPMGGYGSRGGYSNGGGYMVGGEGDMGPMGGDLSQDPVPRPRSSLEGRKLFVSNLPFDCTSNALRETFQQVGNVERTEIILGRNNKSRGMGIVVMRTEQEALVAIAEFDGIEMASRAMSVRLDKNN